jgi:hypothetical protein
MGYSHNPGTKSLVPVAHGKLTAQQPKLTWGHHPGMVSLIALLFALPVAGQGCPHEGPDHRWFGHMGCQLQRKMTIENARPPRTIWSFHVLKLSVKIDPRHPHLLMEWPARSQRLWRFRAGYRWDANAKAYIFPALALKRVDGPMLEYQPNSQQPTKPKPPASASATATLVSTPLSLATPLPRSSPGP